MAATGTVRVRDLRRSFGPIQAIDGVTFEVLPGEIFAIVGPDGAGKTTLIRLLCGAISPDSGEAVVAGADVVRDAETLKTRVGYMPQRFSLYPDLTVNENLQFYGDIFSVPRARFRERSQELLGDFSLAPFGDRLAEQLSGGMKQKLALACTLIHEPVVLLADEPTAGVDPVSRRQFWRILYEINRQGTTIVVTTPYMDEAERALRVAFLDGGRIVSCGTPDELKDELEGDVVEVVCGARAKAKSVLRGDPLVRSVEIFGESLHALVTSAAAAIPDLEGRLAAAGIPDARLRRVPPSLEDTFVARMSA
jgi:ABC-2 type transport system ATP-binding protein